MPRPLIRCCLLLLALWPLAGCDPVVGGNAATNELVLATWNIEHLAARDGAGCRPRGAADYAALRAVADGLDADIIALQEVEDARAAGRVFDPARYELVISARPDDLDEACRGQPGQRRTAQRTGFAIHRERLAARGLVWRELPPVSDLGERGGRWGTRIAVAPVGASGAELGPGGGPALELLAVHLKAGCGWGRLGDDDRVRAIDREPCQTLRRQRGILEAWIDGRVAAGVPFVVLGDFNRQLDQPNDDFWRAIDDAETCTWRPDRDLGRRCQPGSERRAPGADLALAGAGRPYPFAPNPRYPYAIDHVVVGGDAADWLIADSYQALDYDRDPPPSDHHPLRVRLRLPGAGSGSAE